MALFQIKIGPLPKWLNHQKLLGSLNWTLTQTDLGLFYENKLDSDLAAAIQARLRGIYIDGQKIICDITPKLKRTKFRDALSNEAKLRRKTSVGFKMKGTKLDKEGTFSLTPEDIALELGEIATKRSILDVCCGSGGNSIGFARKACKVTAIEIEKHRLADARHNAKVYQCLDKITFIHGDATKEISKQSADILWIDPPWGGYDKTNCKLSDFHFLETIISQVQPKQFQEIWIKLPQAFQTSELHDFEPEAVFGASKGDQHRIKFLLLKKIL